MSKNKKTKGNIIFYIIIVMALIYASFVFSQQQDQLSKLERKHKYIENKICREEKTKDELLEQKKYIDTDEYVEQIAREKLGMIKDKEKIFVDINE